MEARIDRQERMAQRVDVDGVSQASRTLGQRGRGSRIGPTLLETAENYVRNLSCSPEAAAVRVNPWIV